MTIATERAIGQLGLGRRPGRTQRAERVRTKFTSGGKGVRLDLHDFRFFVPEEVVDRLRVLVGELLDAILGAVLLVGPDLAVVDELLGGA